MVRIRNSVAIVAAATGSRSRRDDEGDAGHRPRGVTKRGAPSRRNPSGRWGLRAIFLSVVLNDAAASPPSRFAISPRKPHRRWLRYLRIEPLLPGGFRLLSFTIAIILGSGSLLPGQLDEGREARPPSSPPIARAHRTEVRPVLDGRVLDDPVWQGVPASSGFWQTTPQEGEPASETTEIRIVYDRDYLYFGVVCYDRDPDGIIVSDSRRDSPLDETDSFQLILDTYRDRQNGFVFGTNPAAIEYDGQVTKEGEGSGFGGGRQQGGSGGGFNLNWDGSWRVVTMTGAFGWSAEFEIPFRTLRFGSEEEQIWGINFQRNIRRRNETAFWAPLPRQFNLYRLSLAGSLQGLRLSNPRNFKVIPYILGRIRDREDRPETVWTGDSGADVKYNLTSSLTLDGTYNTDFAQVEVDEQQINLNRFNLFFPEKRPFFLENAGFFAVGDPGETELFFSRRIGIAPDGTPIPIQGGIRLSGKLGTFNNLGFLNMQTEGVDGLEPANNFTVFRYSRELPNRSALGGIFVNRQATGSLVGENDYNRTFGIDGTWGIGDLTDISGFFAQSSTPGIDHDQHAFRIGGRYDAPSWLLSANYSEVADNFNPEVGFLTRRGFRKLDFLVFHTYRAGGFGKLHEIRPHVSYRGFWDFEGFQQTGFLHMDSHWEFQSGHEIHTGINRTREGVSEPFEIAPGVFVPPGTYDHTEAQMVAFTNEGDPVGVRVRITAGGFFGGDRVNFNPTFRLRIGDAFNTEVSLNRNDVHLPFGDFVTNLAQARVSYSFTPRILVQTLIQYNDRTNTWSSNFRFTWLQAANTGLFIVYNDTRGASGFDFPTDRSLIIKFSRMFDLR